MAHPNRQPSISSAIRFSILAAALTALLLHFSSRAEARPGDLDPSFARGGKAVTALDMGTSWFTATSLIAEAPKGALVAIAGDKLIRYELGGRIDRGFGTEGLAKIEVPGFDFSVSDLAVDSAGRAVVFGTATDYGTLLSPYTSSYPAGAAFLSYATVIRYTATGGLDPTFGGGDGIETTDLELPAFPGTTEPSVNAGAGIVDGEDRPVLIGGQREVASPCEGHSHYADFDKLIARLTPAGDLDVSFGGGDGITFLEESDEVSDIAIGAGGRLSVAANPQAFSCDHDFALVRLGPNGGLESSFGRSGIRHYRQGASGRIAIDRFGRTHVQAEGVVRLDPQGDLDATFGRRGRATIDAPGNQSGAGLVAVDSRGRPLLAGTVTFRPQERGSSPDRLRRRFTVIRLDTTGKPDRSFGHRGWVVTRFGRFSTASARDGLIDSKGRLVVSGVVERADLEPTGGIAIARYRLTP
jgi:uncharacterized delta-60 repeat protein